MGCGIPLPVGFLQFGTGSGVPQPMAPDSMPPIHHK